MKNLVLKSVFVVAALGCGLASQEAWAGAGGLKKKCATFVCNETNRLIFLAGENPTITAGLGLMLASIGATRYLTADNKKDFTFLGINFNKVWGGALVVIGSLLAIEGVYAKIPLTTKVKFQLETGLSEATITPLRFIRFGAFKAAQ